MAIALDQDYALEKTVDIDNRPGLPFSFTGKAGEYFGIWIVNILLSIVTLGIYSAWAKVRNKRYFYGNTKLDGSSFNYLASPIQILKGRLIVFAFFVVYALCSSFYPFLAGIFILAMFILTPWVVVKALTFNARQSSYRNVRFDFTGKLREAIMIYIVLPIGTIFTLGLLIPYNAFRMNKFVADHSHYGKAGFSFEGTKGPYYKTYGIAILLFLPFLLCALAVLGVIVYGAGQLMKEGGLASETIMTDVLQSEAGYIIPLGPFLPLILLGAFFFAYTYIVTKLQNYFYNNTKIAGHRLYLDLNVWRVLWIRFSNLVVIALTIGLMIPWARIRMTRYQVERMSLIPNGDLATLVSQQQEKIGTLGEEFGEGMDVDLGLGV